MRIVLRAVGLGLSVGLLLLVGGLAAVLVIVPKAAGATPLTVLTSSMQPTLPPGTLVVIRPQDPSRIRVGEIATYQLVSGRPEVVTHRVVAITTTSAGQRLFTFRGDANGASDADPVDAVQVRGVVWYGVPRVGWANDFVNGAARPLVLPLVAGALFVYSGVMLVLGVRSALRRRSKRPDYRRGPSSRPSANGRARRRGRHVDVSE